MIYDKETLKAVDNRIHELLTLGKDMPCGTNDYAEVLRMTRIWLKDQYADLSKPNENIARVTDEQIELTIKINRWPCPIYKRTAISERDKRILLELAETRTLGFDVRDIPTLSAIEVEGSKICVSCKNVSGNYFTCRCCRNNFLSTNNVNDTDLCESCTKLLVDIKTIGLDRIQRLIPEE